MNNVEGKMKKWIELIQTEKLTGVTEDVQVCNVFNKCFFLSVFVFVLNLKFKKIFDEYLVYYSFGAFPNFGYFDYRFFFSLFEKFHFVFKINWAELKKSRNSSVLNAVLKIFRYVRNNLSDEME